MLFTDGNPLFVREVLRRWRDDGELRQTGRYIGATSISPIASTTSLAGIIRGRLHSISSSERQVLDFLAVLGRPAGFDDLRHLCRLQQMQLVEALDTLDNASMILAEQGPHLQYRVIHPAYERVLLDGLTPTRRALLHQHVYEAYSLGHLHPHGSGSSELAHHAILALEPPAETQSLLRSAAGEAEEAGSYAEAARWYGWLTKLAGGPELIEAIEGQARATANHDPRLATSLLAGALEIAVEPSTIVRLLCARAHAYRLEGKFDKSLDDLAAAAHHASQEEMWKIRHAEAVLYGITGRLEEAETNLQQLEAETRDIARLHAGVLGHLGQLAYVRGSLSVAKETWEDALREAIDRPSSHYLQTNLAWVLILLGAWAEAESKISETLHEVDAAGDLWTANPLLCSAARLAAWRGDLPEAIEFGYRAVASAMRINNPSCSVAAYGALGLALLESGDQNSAASLLDDVEADIRVTNLEHRDFNLTASVFIEACLGTRQFDRALRLLETARANEQSPDAGTVFLDLAEAFVEATRCEPRLALSKLERWLEEPTPILIQRARVLEYAAILRSQLESRSAGLPLAVEARDIYAALGARARQAKIESWVSAVEVQPGRPRSQRPAGLTERELQILGLLTSGLSDKEIAANLVISWRTARKHVENVLSKLGVSKRTQVWTAIERLGIELPNGHSVGLP